MKKIKDVLLVGIVLSFLALPLLVSARVGTTPPTPPITSGEDIVAVLEGITVWLYTIVGTLAILMLIIGGIMYMTAGGDEEKVGKAKNVLKYAVIGLVIALLAYGVKSIILSFM